MKPEKENPSISGINSEEVVDTLTAISVVAKTLAKNIRSTTKEVMNDGNKTDNR